MRIAVMAAGAVGGYFGARLTVAGHDVSFIARGAQLDAIRQNGLRVESPFGDLHLADVKATDNPADIGPVEVVLFAVKLWDTERAGELARPLVGPGTRVITVQNGIDSVERLAPILGADKVVGGIAYISAVIAAPGVIRHTSEFAQIRCGRVDGTADSQLAQFAKLAKEARTDIVVSDDINRERWEKFVFLVALSGATGATRHPLGPILGDADTSALFLSLMREVVAVGRARNVSLAADFADERMKLARLSPPGFKASLLHDLERGNRLELDWLAGKVVELGRSLSVPTPANQAVYAVLKLHRMGRAAEAPTLAPSA
jgi:2-dehydropantoate 2-reductase